MANRGLVDGCEFVDPPSLSRASEAKVEVVSDLDRVSGGDSIFDAFAKGVNVAIESIFADCDDVTRRIAVIDGKVRLEIAEIFNPATSIDLLSRRDGRGIECDGRADGVNKCLVRGHLVGDASDVSIAKLRLCHGKLLKMN